MSRALDRDVLEKLKSQDPTIIYKDLVGVLTSLPENGSLLDIELLGGAHPLEPGVHFLRDENALAIPKLRLAQAFFAARRVIQKHIDSQPARPSHEAVVSTTVTLLMDPEHLTAANIRKQAVLSELRGDRRPETILVHEKQFIDSLLTARLHRHTKSPNLWSHRRWLMERFNTWHVPVDIKLDLKTVIMVAAERHARNYYAWQHARWLIKNTCPKPDTNSIVGVIADVKDWCFRHHNDISGWTFLEFLVSSIEDPECRTQVCSSILAETTSMATSFRWANESVWVFLRSLVAGNPVSPREFQSFLDVSSGLISCIRDDAAKKPLEAALQWISLYRTKIE